MFRPIASYEIKDLLAQELPITEGNNSWSDIANNFFSRSTCANGMCTQFSSIAIHFKKTYKHNQTSGAEI